MPISDCEYDDHEDEDYEAKDYDDGEMSEEEKENEQHVHCRAHFVPDDDDDSAGECEECSMPNRGVVMMAPEDRTPVVAAPQNIRRSQSCVETFTKARADGRMTRSEQLEWDDQI